MWNIDAIHSTHDGGWYCEIFNDAGKTVHTTRVFGSKADAVKAAKGWVERAAKGWVERHARKRSR